MVIPGVVGIAIDRWLGLLPVVFTLLGFGLGMTVGILHLVKIAGALDQSQSTTDKPTHSDEER